MKVKIEHPPWSTWSRTLYYTTDILPPEYHEQYKGWTIDGAYDKKDNPLSPWPLIESLGLHYLVLADIYQADLLIETDKNKLLTATITMLLETINKTRNEFREDKNFVAADKLRDLLKLFGYETQDTKVKK